MYLQELLSKSIVSISDLRTDVEEVKWDNMRRAVGMYYAFYMYQFSLCKQLACLLSRL